MTVSNIKANVPFNRIGTSDPSKVPPGKPMEGEVGRTLYRIYDSWSTELRAVVDIDPGKSGYR